MLQALRYMVIGASFRDNILAIMANERRMNDKIGIAEAPSVEASQCILYGNSRGVGQRQATANNHDGLISPA